MKLLDCEDMDGETAYELLNQKNHITSAENENNKVDLEEVVTKSNEMGLEYLAGYISYKVKQFKVEIMII